MPQADAIDATGWRGIDATVLRKGKVGAIRWWSVRVEREPAPVGYATTPLPEDGTPRTAPLFAGTWVLEHEVVRWQPTDEGWRPLLATAEQRDACNRLLRRTATRELPRIMETVRFRSR